MIVEPNSQLRVEGDAEEECERAEWAEDRVWVMMVLMGGVLVRWVIRSWMQVSLRWWVAVGVVAVGDLVWIECRSGWGGRGRRFGGWSL
jgi:hypothetical protein